MICRMKPTRRFVGAAILIVLAAIAVVAVIAIRYGLAAGPVRAAIESRLSATLGQPVTIGTLRISLTPRVALRGTGVRVGAADTAVPSIDIPRVVVFPNVRSLFSNSIIVEDVLLDGLAVSVLRGTDEGWRVPSVMPAPDGDSAGGVAIKRVRITGGQIRVFEPSAGGVSLASGITDLEADLVPDADGLSITPLKGRIGGASISGQAHVTPGAVRLEFNAPSVADADLPAMLALAGSGRPEILRLDRPVSMSVTAVIDRATLRLTGNGTLDAPALTVGPFRLDGLKAPFRIAGPRLTFAPTVFSTSGGSHRGTLTLDLSTTPPRWTAASRLERIDTGALLDAVAGRDTRVEGEGHVEMNMRGRVDETFAQTMAGRARLQVARGVLRDFPLLASINRAFKLAEADSRDTRFERLSASFDVSGGAATTSDLAIDAADLRVTAAGRIGFDGALNLRGRAAVSAERASAAVASVRELARLRSGSGEIVVPLTIAGTLDQPQFGIDVKAAVGEGLRDELLRRLRRIIK
jgi:hypothetical protein